MLKKKKDQSCIDNKHTFFVCDIIHILFHLSSFYFLHLCGSEECWHVSKPQTLPVELRFLWLSKSSTVLLHMPFHYFFDFEIQNWSSASIPEQFVRRGPANLPRLSPRCLLEMRQKRGKHLNAAAFHDDSLASILLTPSTCNRISFPLGFHLEGGELLGNVWGETQVCLCDAKCTPECVISATRCANWRDVSCPPNRLRNSEACLHSALNFAGATRTLAQPPLSLMSRAFSFVCL